MAQAILLDVLNNSVSKIDLKDDLQEWYRLLDCSTVTSVTRYIAGIEVQILCDDEGLIRTDKIPIPSAFNSCGHPALYNNLLIIGSKVTPDGWITGLSDDDVRIILDNFMPIQLVNKKTGDILNTTILTSCDY